MKIKHTICSYCSVGCGLNLVEDNGIITRTFPYKRHPINEGKNCNNGRNIYEKANQEIKNAFINDKEADLDDAIIHVKDKLKNNPSKTLIIGSGKCTNEECDALKKLANEYGIDNLVYPIANNVLPLKTDTTYDDINNSKVILIVGDILKENPLLGRRIIIAKDNGAKIITVDTADETITGINSDEYVKIESIKDYLDKIDENILNEFDEELSIIIGKLDDNKDIKKLEDLSKNKNLKTIIALKECNDNGASNSLNPVTTDELINLLNSVDTVFAVECDLVELVGEDIVKKIDFLVTENNSFNDTNKLSDIVLPDVSWVKKDGSFTNMVGTTQKFSKVLTSTTPNLEEIIEKLIE
ncbi:MAG: molybdopterin-dependent oxidoreductase [Methanobacteriaceae archaeon]|nr:molybdopterin-dependent oxidoreductase [Methanobacteriaceae archaeon]